MSERAKTNRLRSAHGLIAACAAAVALLASCLAGCSLSSQAKSTDAPIPVASVKRADVQLEVHATGALQSTHTVNLIAPPIGGGTLEIIRLLPTGTPVKAGEVVVAFDPSGQEDNLAESRSQLAEAQEAITEAKDNAAVQAAEDQTALLKAKYGVRQAELKVKMNEMVSAIEAKENTLALDSAKRTLAQTEQDVQSHAATNQAALSVAEQSLATARLGIEQAQQNLSKMQLKTSIDGLVVLEQNYAASGGIYFSGMTLPDFQVGDQVNPGNTVAQVVDVSQMELSAQILQSDRANVQQGDPVEIQVDAIPGVTFHGTVSSAGGIASGWLGTGLNAKVDVTIHFDHPDPRLRPGFTAHVVILGSRLKNALIVPRESVFDLTGTPSVYVKKGSGFERKPATIRYLTDSTAVISGLQPDTEVALVNPTQQTTAPSQPSASGPAMSRGGR